MSELEFENIDEKEEEPKRQRDIDEFTTVPVRRGWLEIESIYQLITPLNAFICGGYVRYMVSPRIEPIPAADVDIYCLEESAYDKLLKLFSELGFNKKHENNMAVSYEYHKDERFRYSPPLQIIKPVKEGGIVAFGSIQEVIENFDFSVIRCGLIGSKTALVDGNFLYDEERKKLRLKNIHCPISSTLRCMKYSRKGYFLRPTECLKLFLDWENRGEDYRLKIADYLHKANEGKGLNQEEVEQLESLMRID